MKKNKNKYTEAMTRIKDTFGRNKKDILWTPFKLKNGKDNKETQRLSPDAVYRNPLFYLNKKEHLEQEKSEK